jgi:hypothetical protein
MAEEMTRDSALLGISEHRHQPSTTTLLIGITTFLVAFPVFYMRWYLNLAREDASKGDKRKLVFSVLLFFAAILWFFAVGLLIGGVAYALDAVDYAKVAAAPFGLDSRPTAAPGGTYGLLPDVVGDFSRDAQTNAFDPIVQQITLPIDENITNFYYAASGGQVAITAIDIAGGQHEATRALRSIRDYASARGNLGNFVIGMNDASYIYYSVGDFDSLAWSHGEWLYIATANDLDMVNAFVSAFPY